MNTREPINLRDIDNYLEDLTEIFESARMALILGLRARMAVSAGAQKSAYGHFAQVGTLLAKIYLAGDASELNPVGAPQSRPERRSSLRGETLKIPAATVTARPIANGDRAALSN
jgi:hypothetical protein